MKFESLDENRQEDQAFSDGESPGRTFALAGKAKWLESKAGKLFFVLWTETIRIKPGKQQEISFSIRICTLQENDVS